MLYNFRNVYVYNWLTDSLWIVGHCVNAYDLEFNNFWGPWKIEIDHFMKCESTLFSYKKFSGCYKLEDSLFFNESKAYGFEMIEIFYENLYDIEILCSWKTNKTEK